MEEIWSGMIGHENDYLISTHGRILSIRTSIHKKSRYGKEFCQPCKQREIKQMIGSTGYYKITLDNKATPVHRLVAMTFIPNPNNYLEVNHIDGNKLNNRVDNLEWCSRQQNAIHATEHGLIRFYGEDNPSSKFKNEDINKIRELIRKNVSCIEISKIYSCSPSTIHRIKSGKRWNHIKTQNE